MNLGNELEDNLKPASQQSVYSIHKRTKALRFLASSFPDMLDFMCVSSAEENARLIGAIEMYLAFHSYNQTTPSKSRLHMFAPHSASGVLNWAMLADDEDLRRLDHILCEINNTELHTSNKVLPVMSGGEPTSLDRDSLSMVSRAKSLDTIVTMKVELLNRHKGSDKLLRLKPSPEQIYRLLPSQVDTLVAVFCDLDADCDGSIGVEELAAMMSKLQGKDVSVAQVLQSKSYRQALS